MTVMADQAPRATLTANCGRMVVLYGIVAEVTVLPIDLQVRTYYVSFPPEFQPEILTPEFRTKLILPWNDLIPTCVPTESRNAAEFSVFQKMMPGRNWNRKRNAHPRLILEMSLSSEALLDHIADFLEFISSAQSFWFSLNTSFDQG